MKVKNLIVYIVASTLLSGCVAKVENTINVINTGDQRAPEIRLDKEIHIQEGEEFNLEDYYSVRDDREIVNVVANNTIDINTVGEYAITLTATDEKGNFSIATSKVYVDPIEEEFIEEEVKPVNVTSNNKPTNQTLSSPEVPVYVPTTPRSPFIDGVKDITVSIDTDPQLVLSILASNVTASGTVWIDITELNTSEEGAYFAYYNSNDGVSESCTVYVK